MVMLISSTNKSPWHGLRMFENISGKSQVQVYQISQIGLEFRPQKDILQAEGFFLTISNERYSSCESANLIQNPVEKTSILPLKLRQKLEYPNLPHVQTHNMLLVSCIP